MTVPKWAAGIQAELGDMRKLMTSMLDQRETASYTVRNASLTAEQAAGSAHNSAMAAQEYAATNRMIREEVKDLTSDIQRLRRELLHDKQKREGEWIKVPAELVRLSASFEITPQQYIDALLKTTFPEVTP